MMRLHAVCVKGEGSRARLKGLKLHSCASNGLFVYAGGEAEVENCEIYNSLESNGCQVKGAGSRLMLRSCDVHDNELSGIYCVHGAYLDVSESNVHSSRKFHGVEVQGEAAEAKVTALLFLPLLAPCVYSRPLCPSLTPCHPTR